MFSQIGKNLWTTKIFFVVRLAAALIVSTVYILVAAGIQYLFVSWFGENTFNYILGGVMSLFIGIVICNYLGRLLFMFVRGWHMAALAYARKIQAKHLPALDAGMRVFSRHFTSFAVVYGSSMLLSKFADSGSEKLWGMLKDIPYLGSLSKLAENPIVKHIARDLLDTGFDAVIFYIVRYTKPGLDGDLEAVPKALRKYLYALPNILGASLSSYLLLYVLPMVARIIIVLMAFMSQGFLGGILMTVLLYPVFFLLKHVVFDPLETIILMSAYSKHCTEEEPEDSIYKGVVDSILESIGLADVSNEDEEESEESEDSEVDEETPAPKARKATKTAPPLPPPVEDEVLDVEPEFDVSSLPLSNIPEIPEEPAEPRFASGASATQRLNNLAAQFNQGPVIPTGGLAEATQRVPHIPELDESMDGPVIPTMDEDSDEDFPAVEEIAPVQKITELLNGIDMSALNAELGSDEDSGVLGGDDIDFG